MRWGLGLALMGAPAFAHAAPWEPDPNVMLSDNGRTSQQVELVDIDADGWVDIVFANSKGEGVSGGPGNAEVNQLFLNDQGTGFNELNSVFEEADNAWVIKAGDIDNDGDADLVVGDNFTGSTSYVLINEGNKTFTREDIVISMGADIGDLELGDIDDDGDLDILATDWGDSVTHGFIDDPGGPLRLWLGNGDGTFSDGSVKLAMGTEVLAAWSFDLELVDIDNDYALDVMVSTRGDADPAVVLRNDGDGNFSTHPVPALQPMYTKNINVAFTPMDFNSDGFLDVISLQDGGLSQCVGDPAVCARRNSVLVSDGASGFTIPPGYWGAADNPGKADFDAATLDFNNDGNPDFVTTGVSIQNTVNSRLFLNSGTTFTPAPPPLDSAFPLVPELAETSSLMFADFNNDRREDVAVAQRDPTLTNHALFGRSDPVDGISEDTIPPRIYDDGLDDKLGILLFFGKDVGLKARVNDFKTPSHWHDYLYDTELGTYNLIGDGADRTASNRRLPYVEMALGLDDPDDIKSIADGDASKFIAPSIWFGEGLWRVRFKVPYNGKPVDTLTWQFCAIDAAGNKRCRGPFTVNVEIDPNDCGDGVKEAWEECDDPADPLCAACVHSCGDGECIDPENAENCFEDCGECDNDGACEPPENAETCPMDCDYDGFCGDDKCTNPPETPENCPDDCGPCDDDDACEPPEDAESCPSDCDYGGYCGDMICQNPSETEENCGIDCLPQPTDDGVCGNDVCDANENLTNCPEDCDPDTGDPMCNDGVCSPGEAVSCPGDCDGDSATTGTGIVPSDGCACKGTDGPGGWALVVLLLLRRRKRPNRARGQVSRPGHFVRLRRHRQPGEARVGLARM